MTSFKSWGAGGEKKVCATAFYQMLQLSLVALINGNSEHLHRIFEPQISKYFEKVSEGHYRIKTILDHFAPGGSASPFAWLGMPPRTEIDFDG